LPDVISNSGELEVQAQELPQAAWYPLLRRDFQAEDLAAARKAVSQALEALNKERDSAKETSSESDEGKNPKVALAEARYAVAQAESESLAARWEADFAKHSVPRDERFDELALAAAKAERQTALCRAELAALQAEQAQATAQQALKPDDAKLKAALT